MSHWLWQRAPLCLWLWLGGTHSKGRRVARRGRWLGGAASSIVAVEEEGDSGGKKKGGFGGWWLGFEVEVG